MKNPPPQSALREIRAHLGRPLTLTALAGATAVLVLAGPFGTLESLGPAGRIGYWGAVVASTYAAGTAVNVLLRPRVGGLARGVRVAAIALATALVVTALVVGLNLLLLGVVPDADGRGGVVAAIFAIAAIASATLHLTRSEEEPARAEDADGPPPLLARLPLEKRGALVALSVEDHYVRIRTTRGEEMLLMRLGDAIREAAPTPGLQVHRSHWVAIGAVRAARREGDRAVLEMAVGGDIPASRSHIPALREAGLLPR
ncbi:hypothetical protein HKCCSP123_11225 [Rhodobacterales bacterium HKCCSP123]|nr:hypothetical protein [Rhodobacterales bacterium HKCCSP123]